MQKLLGKLCAPIYANRFWKRSCNYIVIKFVKTFEFFFVSLFNIDKLGKKKVLNFSLNNFDTFV